MLRRITVAAALLLVLPGCAASTEVITLRHPSTGQTVKCGPYKYDAFLSGSLKAEKDLRNCVEDFKHGGYVRSPE